MTVMTRTKFDVVPLSKHIGAEIRGLDLREKPDGDTGQSLLDARAHRFSLERAPADAAHHDQGHSATVLRRARRRRPRWQRPSSRRCEAGLPK